MLPGDWVIVVPGRLPHMLWLKMCHIDILVMSPALLEFVLQKSDVINRQGVVWWWDRSPP